ncbi:MAG: leucine-rich repeat domain-containing protein, partial [Oscillospiraceae bacterium]|nr:leucine-rich repeat domain-containing protein [Oscillospiraceae bacterium]
MSKRILVIVFTVCLAIVGMTVMAIADTVSGNGWNLDTSTGVLTISSDTGTSDWYNKGRVQYRESVKSVVIESGVATICDSAFYNCTKLASVTIPSSVTSIG